LRILKAKLTDSGQYKCDIVFSINGDLKVKTLASYEVHVVGKLNRYIVRIILTVDVSPKIFAKK